MGFLLPAALALVAVERLAQGAEPTESVRLVYHAPSTCPTRADFIAAIAARTNRASLDASDEAAHTFVVDVEFREPGWTGRLAIRTKNGQESQREVAGASCRVVVDALAFFSALAIDPSASLSPVSAAPTSAPPPSEPPRAAPREPVREPPPTLPPIVHEPPRPAPAWHLFLGSGATVVTGIAPAALVSAAPSVEIADDRAGLFSPTVSLALRAGRSGSQETLSGAFTVAWTALEIASCPLRARLVADLAVRLCAIVEVGQMSLHPFGVSLPVPQAEMWWGLGGLARFEQLLADRVLFWFEAGPVVPTRRTAYYFRPSDVVVQQVAEVGGRATLSLAVRLF